MTDSLDTDRLRALIDAGGVIVSDLDPDSILDRVLETAQRVTGARYAALGVLDPQRRELERFITRGVDEKTERSIGAPPRGRGVLGVLIDDPRPLRLSSVGDHPSSYGFPAAHPPMNSFLGVPVIVRGDVWGNLYLAEKEGGEFDQADEDAAVVLARWAAIAIGNARYYGEADARRLELEHALRGLEATQAIAMAIGAETDLERVLELIVKRGRALADARSVVIFLRDGEHLVPAASAGHTRPVEHVRLPIGGSTAGEVMRDGRPMRLSDARSKMRVPPEQFGVDDATSALIVPLVHRGVALGVLTAFDRGEEADTFDEDDEAALRTFAASAATAVATAQSVQEERLHASLAASDAERRRWAQELHDETLQGLGALRVLLSSARRTEDPGAAVRAIDGAIAGIEQEITNLRSIITELRPAALDQLGLVPALEALVERHETVNDLQITTQLPGSDVTGRLIPPGSIRATTVYRVIQEALNNVVKHAGAEHVWIELRVSEDVLVVEVSDDGRGFAAGQVTAGFGLVGMRERVLVNGGELAIDSDASGTRVRAAIPLDQEAAAAVRSATAR